MTQEDYVSFEVAKLMKEKGYNEECDAYYHNDNSSAYKGLNNDERFEYCGGGFYNDRNFYRDAAPTLWDAAKWLRKEHKVAICPIPYSSYWDYTIFDLKDFRDDDGNHKFLCHSVVWESYEQALNEGIKEAMELI